MTSYLLAYFRSEEEPDGEQVRLAVSSPDDPTRWTPLAGGEPVLRSTVGEAGVRDPFLVREPESGRIHLLATDLRVGADHDWARAVRHGSRAIVAWSTDDLVSWTGPRRIEVSPAQAGNTWAPKAFWSPERGAFLLIWASALYPDGHARDAGTHQRLLAAPTRDFLDVGPAELYLDPGHDVIDATFLVDGDSVYRFSANAQGGDDAGDVGHHIFMERGRSLEDPAFTTVRVDVGRPELERGEGPAVFADPDTGTSYLLIDEFGLRGYQLFRTRDLASGAWEHVADAELPPGARHGSVLPISADERARLLSPA